MCGVLPASVYRAPIIAKQPESESAAVYGRSEDSPSIRRETGRAEPIGGVAEDIATFNFMSTGSPFGSMFDN